MIRAKTKSSKPEKRCRILSLDGGGSKGVYTLGVLQEIEAVSPVPLHEYFDLIYGTSTGAIIATLLACGESVGFIRDAYFELIPSVMGNTTASGRSKALSKLAGPLLRGRTFESCKTNLGIVAVRCDSFRPLIFKTLRDLAHSRNATFVPGFGVPLSEAVIASCSTYPYFDKHTVHTNSDDNVETIDGGFVANDPTLFAITDAVTALKCSPDNVRVLSIGTGDYPAPTPGFFDKLKTRFAQQFFDIALTETIMRSNANTLDILRGFVFPGTPCIRINERFNLPRHQTTFLENDLQKLRALFRLGRDSVRAHEDDVRRLFRW